MAKEIIMPKFGFTQEDSTIVQWLVEEGTAVEKGDPICEVTTDKINMEVEAPEDGVLGGVQYHAGDTVPVTEIIAFILQEGEEVPEVTPAKKQPEATPRDLPSSFEDSVGWRAPAPKGSLSLRLAHCPLVHQVWEGPGYGLQLVRAQAKI